MDYLNWLQILMELALAVSGEQATDALYHKAAKAFMAKLDCTTFALVDGGNALEFVLPKWGRAIVLFYLGEAPPGESPVRIDGRWVYRFPLKECGALILVRGQEMPKELTYEIVPIVDMLAANILGCKARKKQRESEEVIRTERALLRQFIDTMPDMVYYKKLDGEYILVNRAVADRMGLAIDEIVGRRESDILPREVIDSYADMERAAVASKKPAVYENHYALDGGDSLSIETSLVPFFAESGEALGIIGITRDITRRRAVEEMVRRRMEFQNVLMNLAISFINIDLDSLDRGIDDSLASAGEFIGVDRSYLFLYDYEREVMNNTHEWCKRGIEPAIELLQNVPLEPFRTGWIDHHLLGETIIINDVEALPKESPVYQLLHLQGIKSVITLPLKNKDDLIGFVGFDAVERRKDWGDDEVSLLLFLAEIYTNALIRRRHEKELIEAKRLAESANQAKSAFLSNMSHELRTPLNAVIGFAQLLEFDRDSTAPQREYVGEIVKSGKYLLGLINEILDLARIESGKLDLEVEPANVSQIIDSILPMVLPMADKYGVRIFNEYNRCDSLINTDVTRFKQVLINLFSNAIKYNRESGSVTISCRRRGREVELHVADTGIGIPGEALTKIFEPFYRLEEKKYAVDGTGIGLAVVKQLLERMGGTIRVESAVGVGSNFYLTLPLARAAEQEDGCPEALPSPRQDRPGPGGRTVLYTEDNPSNLMLVERIIGKIPNVRLLTAATAREGLALARAERPDLMLLDINLPDMDGNAMLEALRSQGETADIPAIAVSANAMAKDIRRAIEIGFSDYITKPIDVPTFLNKVLSFLGGGAPDPKGRGGR